MADLQPRRDARAPQRHRRECSPAARRPLSPDHFSEADGLASAQCNGGAGPSAVLDQAGKVWIATAGGAAVVDPKALDRYHRQVPPVVDRNRSSPTTRRWRRSRGLDLTGGHALARIPLRQPQLPHAALPALPLSPAGRGPGLDRPLATSAWRSTPTSAPGNTASWSRVSAPGLSQGLEQGRDRARHRDPAAAVATRLVPGSRWRCWPRCSWSGLSLALAQHAATRGAARGHHQTAPSGRLRDQTERLDAGRPGKTMLLAEGCRSSPRPSSGRRWRIADRPANRRSISEEPARAFDRATSSGMPLKLRAARPRPSKRINDTYSHLSGDHALVAGRPRAGPAKRARWARSRRWGGEEFAVLFEASPSTRRRQLLRTHARGGGTARLQPTRAGLEDDHQRRRGQTHRARLLTKLVSRADDLLYEAKRSGRNRISRLSARSQHGRHHRDQVVPDQALAERPVACHFVQGHRARRRHGNPSAARGSRRRASASAISMLFSKFSSRLRRIHVGRPDHRASWPSIVSDLLCSRPSGYSCTATPHASRSA